MGPDGVHLQFSGSVFFNFVILVVFTSIISDAVFLLIVILLGFCQQMVLSFHNNFFFFLPLLTLQQIEFMMNRLYHKDTCEQTLLIKPRLNDISHIFNGFVFFNYRCVIMQNYLVFHGEVVLSVLFSLLAVI